ncbi:MAG: hypothetical protein ACRYFX_07575 [Janthinobacterium lividum]
MKTYYPVFAHRRPLALAGLLSLLGLAQSAYAQEYNSGTATNTGSLYHGGAFTNAGTGAFTNTGTIYYTGPSTATFSNAGTYAATSPGLDQFEGPGRVAGAQELAGTVAPTFFGLTLTNTVTSFALSNTAGADVSDVFTFGNTGILTTTGLTAAAASTAAANTNAAGALRLNTTGSTTLAGTNTHYIDGFLAKAGTTSFAYPLGATNTNSAGTNPATNASGTGGIYSPLTLSSPGGTAVRYVAGATPNSASFATQGGGLQLTNVSRLEYYPIGTVGAAANSTITMPYGNFGLTSGGTVYVGNNPATLTIAGYDGTRWTNLSALATNPVNTTNQTVTVQLPAALSTSYTALALASTSTANPLPVQLTVFTAVKKEADGLLSWTTASEVNSAYFEVQASADGAKWQVLGQVKAAGTSNSPRNYSWLDKQLARYGSVVVYYRLNQADQDGKASFSPVRTLAPDALAWGVSAYPNPFAAELMARLTTPEAGPVTLTLLDALGRTVLRREMTATAGTLLLDVQQGQALAAGTYSLLVRQGQHLATVHLTH